MNLSIMTLKEKSEPILVSYKLIILLIVTMHLLAYISGILCFYNVIVFFYNVNIYFSSHNEISSCKDVIIL